MISNNEKQFIGKDFGKALTEFKINHLKSSVAYPQSYGQVEGLLDAHKVWANELHASSDLIE